MKRIPPGGGCPPLGHAAEHLKTRFHPAGTCQELMAAEEGFGKTRGRRITAGTFFGSTSFPNSSADGGDVKRAARRPASSRAPTNSPSSAASCIPGPIAAAEHEAVPGLSEVYKRAEKEKTRGTSAWAELGAIWTGPADRSRPG
jgi:hypothetical protein